MIFLSHPCMITVANNTDKPSKKKINNQRILEDSVLNTDFQSR